MADVDGKLPLPRPGGKPLLAVVRAEPVADAPALDGDAAVVEGAADALDDDTLMARARGGDRSAFETLVRRHQRKVLSFATRFFGQEAIASDVAQEAFLDLLSALPRYRPEGRFPLYLYRITLNRCRMAARSYRYEGRGKEKLWVEQSHRPTLAPDEVAARERQRQLARALLDLPEKHRAVLQLRFWGGLSHQEIAEVLETREGTVKSRLFNGLAMLRERLGGDAGELL